MFVPKIGGSGPSCKKGQPWQKTWREEAAALEQSKRKLSELSDLHLLSSTDWTGLD